jgi:MscS family membrane protein
MTRTWGAIAAATIACLLSAAPIPAQEIAFDSYPLEPPETTSPRDTLRSFLAHANEAIQQWRAEDGDGLTNPAALRALRCLDLSGLPPAVREELGVEKMLLLKEILDRVELPDFEEIPGADQLAATPELARWRLPHTEITIARIDDGPRAGEFLFSAATVDEIERFYSLSEHLPYKRDATVGIYEDVVRAPGDWIPRSWVDGLPAWSEQVVLEEALWQWLALLLSLALFIAVMTILFLWAAHWDKRRRRGSQVGKILFVIALLSLSQLFVAFVDHGINTSGEVLVVVEVALQVMVYIAGGWLVALLLTLIGESMRL